MSDNRADLEGLSPAKRALLARRLRERAAAHGGDGPHRRPAAGPMPLSFAQQRLWLLDQLQPGLTAYNVGRVLRLRGALDVPALSRALSGLVTRHESLRTAFVVSGDAPVARVLEPASMRLETSDVSGERDPEQAAHALALDELRRPFDLASGRPLRARVLRLADEDHVLVLVLHHVVSDEGSKGVIFRELSKLYAAERAGRAAELEPLALQYGDYPGWERERPAPANDQRAWWRGQLAGAPPELELPGDFPRPAVSALLGGRHWAALDAATLDTLRGLARAEGATLFMVLLAAFEVLLARTAASEDIVIGAPVSSRTRPELQDLVGLFGNTLVLRTDLAGDPTFRELVGRVRASAVDAYAHQDVPFERLVEELVPTRDLARHPLVQVLFNFIEDPSDDTPELVGLEVEPIELDPGVTKVDLALVASVRDDGLRIMWEYSRELFNPSTIERFTHHLTALLHGAAAAPDTPVGDLPMLSAQEHAAATTDLERTAAPIPPGRLTDVFGARAAERPDAIAVRAGASALTYAEVEARASRIARALVAAGVRPGDLVGVLHGRSVDLVAALLGVHKAGAAYVPLDPALPPQRLALMLDDSGARVLVTELGLLDRVPAGLATVATDDPDLHAPDDVLLPDGAATDVAYVIYTSGSTGKPKGVEIEHRSLLNLLRGIWCELGFGDRETLLAVTTLSFDISALEIFGPLIAGGEVVLAEDGQAADPDALRDLLTTSGATVMQATPATWRMLVDAGWTGDPELSVLCGGEALAPGLAAALLERSRVAWNVYGPTETTVWSTCWRISGAPLPIPIGSSIANTACYVLDAAGRPVAPGALGELCIGGAGVARGYHERPELSAERFVEDPFVPGGRMYRTGDLARRRADGVLEYIGRRDQQVKLRGFRIELGEIEAALAEHPGVRDVIAAVQQDPAGDGRLVAYVVGGASEADLRALAVAVLPAHMVPSLFVALEALPLTPNGKLDRAALPAPELGDASAHVPPRTEIEAGVAKLYAEVLGAESVGAHDDFFALGGHSLAATRLMARINVAFSVRLPLRTVFEVPSVAGLAERVERGHTTIEPPLVPPPVLSREPRGQRRVERSAVHRPAELAASLEAARGLARPGQPDDVCVFPTSFQQRRVWFLDRLDPGTAVYNVPVCIRVRGRVDPGALQLALDALARRHEILRTTLVEHDGEPLQVIHPPAPFAFDHVDATEATADTLVHEHATAPFDLAGGPLARALLVTSAPDAHLLSLVLHHTVVDGWALGLLLHDLSELLAGRTLDVPALEYADYASWQRRWLVGSALDAEVAWWRTTLLGAPAELELPSDRPRPAVADHAGARHVATLDDNTLVGLEALAAERGATLFMVLVCAVQTLLARYTGEHDVVVGAPVSGRPLSEMEGIAGYLANTVVLRTGLSGDPTFAEAIDRVRESVLGALAHQDVPFDRLVEELSVGRDLSRHPLFGVLVMLQDDRPPELAIAGTQTEMVDIDRGVSRFDLSLSFARREEGLRVAWEYPTALFDASTVARFADHLASVLKAAVAAPQTPLSEIEIMPAAERAAVVETFNATGRELAPECAHELVARRATERPEAEAVVCAGRTLTYGELDRRATRLARELVAAGAGPGTLVGVRIERSVDLLVAIHGVLRAGAAYIPLDPDYPGERVAFMLADAKAPLVVTRRELLDSLPAGDAEVVCVDDPALERHSSDPLEPRAGLRDLAYVIYTSGSTGRPKGVMIEHRGLVNLLVAMGRHPGIEPGETMLGLTTPAFDLSVPDLHLPLVRGARLALATAVEATDPLLLARVLRETEATLVQATPSTWRMLLEDGWRPERPMRIVVGGEAVPEALAAQLRDITSEAWNFYGPTETTVWSTCWRIGHLDGEVPIGRPLDNTSCYVLDERGHPVPYGVLGELHLGGAGVARGYLDRAELTAEKFIPSPFAPDDRLYRTGDVVRLRPDGLLAFAGRRDHQVKLRGFRIELGEIVATLEQHPAVRSAAVIVREDEPNDQRLVAYVVADAEPDAADLRTHLARTLPAYMLPGAFVALPRLPLTPNGKLDRAALLRPAEVARPQATAPRTPIEERLVELWTDVLGRSDLGVDDNVFHFGAHSLLVTRVVSRVREALGVELSLRSVYEHPTVAEMAEAVSSAMVLGEQSHDLEALLAELEGMPDDEVLEAP